MYSLNFLSNFLKILSFTHLEQPLVTRVILNCASY